MSGSTISDPADTLNGPEPAIHDRRIAVDGMSLHYLEAGSGRPLLLLHGHEQSASGWRWVIGSLAGTFRVLAPSLPGHGGSDPAIGKHSPGSDLGPLMTAFLTEVGVGQSDVVGHSAGGLAALHLSLAAPDRVRTLTLVDSAGLGREVHPLLAMDTLPGLGEFAVLLSQLPGGDVGRSIMSTAMLFAQPWRVPAEFFTEQQELGRRRGQLASSTAMARAIFDVGGQREVLLERLIDVTAPTLVVWGALDCVVPVSQAQDAVRRLPAGRLEIVPDCGHLPHVERPEEFVAIMTAFLAEH